MSGRLVRDVLRPKLSACVESTNRPEYKVRIPSDAWRMQQYQAMTVN